MKNKLVIEIDMRSETSEHAELLAKMYLKAILEKLGYTEDKITKADLHIPNEKSFGITEIIELVEQSK